MGLDMIGYCKYYRQTVLDEADCFCCPMPWGCQWWSENKLKYKCVYCGRIFLQDNIIHKCKGTLRKRNKKFIIG